MNNNNKEISPAKSLLPERAQRGFYCTPFDNSKAGIFVMKKKVCFKCGIERELIDFYRHYKMPDGRLNKCKLCANKDMKEYSQTRDGVMSSIYATQRQRSKNYNWDYPNYTKKELQTWCFNNIQFDELYNNWVKNNYLRKYKPSIDRIDDYKPYSLDNISLTTWHENIKRAGRDKKNGVNNKVNKAVNQYDSNGKFIQSYYSMHHAERLTGYRHSSISEACKSGKIYKNNYWALCKNYM